MQRECQVDRGTHGRQRKSSRRNEQQMRHCQRNRHADVTCIRTNVAGDKTNLSSDGEDEEEDEGYKNFGAGYSVGADIRVRS